MKVALFSYAWPSESAVFNPGVESLVSNLAESLAKRVEVTVFVANTGTQTSPPEEGPFELIKINPAIRSGALQLNQISFARALLKRHSDILREFDVLHDIGSLLPLFSKAFEDTGIATFHHYEPPKTLKTVLRSIPVPMLLKREARVPTVIAVSQFAREQFRSYFSIRDQRVYVIPDGVDLSVFNPDGPAEDQREGYHLLYVGSLIQRKDPRTLLRALHLLRQEKMDVKLSYVGSGPEKKRLRTYANRNGLSSNVTFIAHLPTKQLVEAYQESDLVVLPSKLEGFGMVALESMACGTPPVYSRIPPLVETIADAGISFEPGNATELAACLRHLLLNQDLRLDLRKRGLQRAKNYEWTRIANEHLEVYGSTLAG